ATATTGYGSVGWTAAATCSGPRRGPASLVPAPPGHRADGAGGSEVPVELSGAQALWDAEPGYLNTASYGLPPLPAWEQLQRALADWRVGRTSWEVWSDATDRSRAAFAR